MGIWEMSPWQLIKAGGPIMVPIVLCSFFGLAIVISKFIYFSLIDINIPEFKHSIFDQIRKGNIHKAVNLCETSKTPLAKILKAGILKFGTTRDEIKEAMEDASLYEVPKLEQRLGALATIAHVCPLLGLLGTVTGISSCFHTIQMRANSLNPITPGDLAGGIWEALITTVAGLIVAIPIYVAYNYFVSRVNGFVIEMERGATELLNLLTSTSESQSAKKEV